MWELTFIEDLWYAKYTIKSFMMSLLPPSSQLSSQGNWGLGSGTPYSRYKEEVSWEAGSPDRGLLLLFNNVWLCNTMNCRTPGLPVPHYLPECAQVHSIESVMLSNLLILCQPLLLLSIFPSIRVFFWWIGSSHQVVKVLKLQLQHHSFQWVFRVDFL